jgi:fatty acid desaturase
LEGRTPWIREAILAGQRYHIRTKRPLVHDALNLSVLAALFALLALVAWSGTVMDPRIYLALAPFAFGMTYFAIFVLVVHEASHGMFFISKNRRLRDRVNRWAGWAVAVFFAVHYHRHWEVGHLEHHVRPLEPNDPQQHNTLTGKDLAKRLFACVFIPGFLFLERTVFRAKKAHGGKSASSKGVIVAFVLLWSTVLTLLTLELGAQVALSAFLGIHVIVGLNHIKGSLEHGGALRDHEDAFLRSRSTFFFGRWLVMPFNITLHFEHHLNYLVPWYDLVRYHRDLRAIVPPDVGEDVWNHHPLAQLGGRLGGVRAERDGATR